MGKNKYIETPEKMWELFVAYKEEVKSNPRRICEYVGRDGEERQKPLERPLTIEGFKNYCARNAGDINRYWNNIDNECNEYVTICSRIREEIREDQIEGGMVGQYNPSITQRLNGLTDKQEVKQETTIKSLDITILDDGIPLAGNEKDIED